MENRRSTRTVIDPKVRQVGFFAPPDRTPSVTACVARPTSGYPPVSDVSPSGNSLSPVMIPPPRHLADLSRPVHFPPVPLSPLRRPGCDSIPVGSYNSSEFGSPSRDVSYDFPSPSFAHRASPGKFASSLPAGGLDLSMVKLKILPLSPLTTVSMVSVPPNATEKIGELAGVALNEHSARSKSLKEKTSKAEKRALHEAQRTAKAAAKAEATMAPLYVAVPTVNSKSAKIAKAPPAQNKYSFSLAASETWGGDQRRPSSAHAV